MNDVTPRSLGKGLRYDYDSAAALLAGTCRLVLVLGVVVVVLSVGSPHSNDAFLFHPSSSGWATNLADQSSNHSSSQQW